MSQATEGAKNGVLDAPGSTKGETVLQTAQRGADEPGRTGTKDSNTPREPVSAFTLFLQDARSDPQSAKEIFGDEANDLKQSILAAAKWRSMTDNERKVRANPSEPLPLESCSRLFTALRQPFLDKAEQDNLDYETPGKSYETGSVVDRSSTDIGTTSLSDGQFVPVPVASFTFACPPQKDAPDTEIDGPVVYLPTL